MDQVEAHLALAITERTLALREAAWRLAALRVESIVKKIGYQWRNENENLGQKRRPKVKGQRKNRFARRTIGQQGSDK